MQPMKAMNMPASPSGQIAAPPQSTDTLDEPIIDTLLRDAKLIGTKLRYVLVPAGSRNELRNWDLWGPLILCLFLSIVLSFNDPGQASYKFSIVFAIVWFGATLATINALLLGGNISVFQSVCVLGYCMFPLNIASVVLQFVSPRFLRLLAVSVAFFWSSRASVGFMSPLVPEGRKALGCYPIILFYVTIAWMVIIS